jgi:ABC-type antimicrobial peptide transport system permease subunit
MVSDSQLLEGNKIKIGKQIVLPLSKAVEISFRGLKVRFWRSLITMSGIILAIAFMVSIWAGSSVLKGLWTKEIKNQVVIVDIKEETNTLRYTLEGSSEEKEVEVTREKAIYNKVYEVLRRKGLQDPEEATVAARNSKLGSGAAGDSKAEAEDQEAAAKVEAVASSEKRDLWLVVLSLCVAVVGIVNSMLMSVTERFREIGTMKCLGALDSFVIKLFLLESTFVGFIGTLIGVILGLLLTLVSSLLTYWVLRGLLFVALPWHDVIWGIGVAVVSGTALSILGAIYPAIVAARMEPVAALRQDN